MSIPPLSSKFPCARWLYVVTREATTALRSLWREAKLLSAPDESETARSVRWKQTVAGCRTWRFRQQASSLVETNRFQIEPGLLGKTPDFE